MECWPSQWSPYLCEAAFNPNRSCSGQALLWAATAASWCPAGDAVNKKTWCTGRDVSAVADSNKHGSSYFLPFSIWWMLLMVIGFEPATWTACDLVFHWASKTHLPGPLSRWGQLVSDQGFRWTRHKSLFIAKFYHGWHLWISKQVSGNTKTILSSPQL